MDARTRVLHQVWYESAREKEIAFREATVKSLCNASDILMMRGLLRAALDLIETEVMQADDEPEAAPRAA